MRCLAGSNGNTAAKCVHAESFACRNADVFTGQLEVVAEVMIANLLESRFHFDDFDFQVVKLECSRHRRLLFAQVVLHDAPVFAFYVALEVVNVAGNVF